MVDFARFAQGAAAGEKTFVLVHGSYPTDYASTAECADFLLAAVAGERAPSDRVLENGLELTGEVHVGGFHLYGSTRKDPDVHVECFRALGELIRLHAR